MKPAETSIVCNHYPPRNVLTLEQLWKDKLRQNSSGIFVKELTMKDRGMLKHFIRYTSPYDPFAVMGSVLNNWPSYANSVEYKAGLCAAPIKPSIPFLLKYCAEAVNFHLEMDKPEVTLMSNVKVPKPDPTGVAKAKAIQEAPEEKKVTLEDIEALEKELGL